MSNINIFSADFETTTIEPVKVWAWGIENIETNEYYKGESIEEFINYCKHLPNGIIYFHNLKFDCNFIIHYLLSHNYTWQRDSKMCSFNDFTTLISDKGRFYSVTVYFNKSHGHTNKITFYDSLNIVNMPIEKLLKILNFLYKRVILTMTAIILHVKLLKQNGNICITMYTF